MSLVRGVSVVDYHHSSWTSSGPPTGGPQVETTTHELDQTTGAGHYDFGPGNVIGTTRDGIPTSQLRIYYNGDGSIASAWPDAG